MKLDEILRMEPPINPAVKSDRVILYGAGGLGRFTCAAMREAGIVPLAFGDSNPSKWGMKVDGVPVLRAPWCEFPDATTVVTIFTGAAVRKQLRDVGLDVVSFPEFYRHRLLRRGANGLALPFGSIDDPGILRQHAAAIEQAHGLWADEASRAEFRAQLEYRITLDDACLPPSLPAEDTYFPPELPWLDRECFVDCGAFDGDTVRAYLHRRPTQDRIIAVEPDPANADRLVASLYGQNYSLVKAALSDHVGAARFAATGTAGAALSPDGKFMTELVTLDQVLADEVPTRIKMDIEGAELAALAGGAAMIVEHKPSLAVCLYHKPEDLWTIPTFLKTLVPDYDLYLRRYSDDCWELVCYAVARRPA